MDKPNILEIYTLSIKTLHLHTAGIIWEVLPLEG